MNGDGGVAIAFALDGLATSLLAGDLHLRCRDTVGELLTFVKLPGGRAGHGSPGQLAASREAVAYLKLGARW